MKIVYSQLKKLLPNLSVTPKQLRDDLTMIGHFVSGFEETNDDAIFDLEIRQNRADCLGYYGIARDLSVLYQINLAPLSQGGVPAGQGGLNPVPITISSPDVLRIQATTISGIKIGPSPEWLQHFLALHDINSINNLVDITNYAMLISGIPCHAFDTRKVPQLVWENNLHQKYQEFITLDGTNIKLTDNCLLVTDNSKVVSLGFIGGLNSGIDNSTTDTLIEMAVYTPSRIRADSRQMKTVTEASIRLDKFLDTDTIPLGFSFLIDQILTICGGHISGQLLDIYPPSPQKREPITFDPTKPALYAGIDIPAEFSLNCLTCLGCTINNSQVTPPSIRKDITLKEDLIEEVIRFYGYHKIPTSEPIDSTPLPDITPPVLKLIEKTKDDLVTQGYDEVRSWPLVATPLDPATAIKTQNSINSEYPYLRQSIIQSLQSQLDQYHRLKLPLPKFFEIGKIFSQKNGQIIEQYALGTYDGQNFSETILDTQEKPTTYTPSTQTNTAIELTSQIITLDANVSFDTPQDSEKLIKDYSAKINPKILWSIEIADIYQNRYTFRVSYYNCDDKTAKKVHLSTFNLN